MFKQQRYYDFELLYCETRYPPKEQLIRIKVNKIYFKINCEPISLSKMKI